MLGNTGHLNERVGLARAVEFAAAGFPEAEFGIEGAGLGVGFVDFEGDFDARREGVADQSAGDTPAKRTGVDEEGIDLIARGAEEGNGVIVVIDGDPEAGLREILVANETGKEFEVGGCEEMVGGLDGGEPEGMEAVDVGGG